MGRGRGSEASRSQTAGRCHSSPSRAPAALNQQPQSVEVSENAQQGKERQEKAKKSCGGHTWG